ncbi:hypothetical protein F5887DRAFT_935603, partial [Amanita rubescens]
MSYYGPQEDGHMLFLERTFLLATFIATIGYGVQLVLYGSCALYLWKQRNRQGKLVFFRLAYITILIILESLIIATSTWVIESMYIQNRDYPGGPMAWFLAVSNEPVDIIFYWSFFALTFMSDLLVLWRCWVIWNTVGKSIAYAVISIPAAMIVASFGFGVMWAYQSSRPDRNLYSQFSRYIGTIYYGTSLGVNVLLTILIIWRLALYRRAILNILPADCTKDYLSVATIVVESLLLYSIFALPFIVTYALDNPMNQVFMFMTSACQQIAGYLVVLRVAKGQAWSSNTLARGPVSECDTEIRFNPPVPTTQGGIESRINYSFNKHLSIVGDTKTDMQDL